MRFKASVIAVLLAACAATAQPARAQSLAELARKEQERRKAAKPGQKVYTNKDLPDVPASAAGAPADPASDTAGAAPPPAGDGSAAATDVPADASKEPARDQAYWAGRMKELQAALDRDQLFAQALQVQVDSLTTDFTNRDDPAQRALIANNRQKALDELARQQKAVDAGRQAITAFEEEARRASVPPGWLR